MFRLLLGKVGLPNLPVAPIDLVHRNRVPADGAPQPVALHADCVITVPPVCDGSVGVRAPVATFASGVGVEEEALRLSLLRSRRVVGVDEPLEFVRAERFARWICPGLLW